jgi:hypothetical protein
MKKLLVTLSLSFIGIACFSQTTQKIGGVFNFSGDTAIKLIINSNKFAYINPIKRGDLATPCCDTITYGDISYDSSGFLILKSDPSLNSVFIGMEVIEGKKEGSDSIFFNIHNPIEQDYHKFNSKGGDLIYSLLVDPYSRSPNYFKENNQPFEGRYVRFYNPAKLGLEDFTISITPKNSIYVKNLAVRELSTLTYKVKSKTSNVFEIYMPQLTYGFISYERINGDYAKFVDQNTIIWKGRRFIKMN